MGTKKSVNKKESTTIILNGQPFEVPPGGSLGVLALGNIGVRAWRQAAKDYKDKGSKVSGNEEKK